MVGCTSVPRLGEKTVVIAVVCVLYLIPKLLMTLAVVSCKGKVVKVIVVVVVVVVSEASFVVCKCLLY